MAALGISVISPPSAATGAEPASLGDFDTQAQHAELAVLLGKRVVRFRRIANMTQAALAAAIGVKPQTISKLESGAIAMSAAQLWRLSRALNQPVADFLAGLPGAAPKIDADPHVAAELGWDDKDRSGPGK